MSAIMSDIELCNSKPRYRCIEVSNNVGVHRKDLINCDKVNISTLYRSFYSTSIRSACQSVSMLIIHDRDLKFRDLSRVASEYYGFMQIY